MGLADIYELTDAQMVNGKECVNVYFYRQQQALAIAVTSAQFLAEHFRDQVLPSILGAQHTQVTHIAIRARNLFEPSDQYELLVSVNGTVSLTSNEAMPRFVTSVINLQNDNGLIKAGRKSLAGIGEAYGYWGVITSSTIQSALIQCAIKFKTVLTEGALAVQTYAPVMVKRVRSGEAGAYQYRLPENLGETVWGYINNAVARFTLSTVNSRKG